MKHIILTLPLNPKDICTAQQKGARVIGRHRVMFYTKPEVLKSNERIHTALVDAATSAGLPVHHTFTTRADDLVSTTRLVSGFPSKVPLSVAVRFYFPYPSGTPKCRRNACTPMVDRPDVDNLLKSLLDEMTAFGVWDDDAQISSLSVSKVRTDNQPKIIINITECVMIDGVPSTPVAPHQL